MSPTSAISPPRVAANLAHACGGVWRLTFRRFLLPGHWLTLAAGLGVLWLLTLAGVHRHDDMAHYDVPHYFRWVVGFYLTFLVPILAFISAAGAMRDEMKSGTVDYVLTRPIPRPAFVVFKFLAHVLCTQVDFLLAFVVVLVAANARGISAPLSAAVALWGAQALVIVAFSAFGFLCGVLTSRYVVIGLAYAGIIEAGVGQIPTQLSRLSMTHQVRAMLAYLTDPSGPAAAASPSALATSGLLLAFAAVTLALAAALFTAREFAGAGES
jgi:ABC-2 type transport system permease protein